MITRLLQIVCLVSTVFYFGCQEQNASVNSAETLNRQVFSQADNTIVIAYYFHRTVRCPSCLAIESNADRTIKDTFSRQIANGKLVWMPFNLDEPGGEEFEKQFKMSANTLVLVKMKEGNCVEYKNLEKVWELLNDYERFSKYVTNELNSYLIH